jgi:hypothetical protein
MTNVFSFPHDPLTPLAPNQAPTAKSIRQLRKEVYGNLASVRTPIGGGNYGHIGMVMPPAAYQLMAGAVYLEPLPAPLHPVYQGNGAAVAQQQNQQAEMRRTYDEFQDLRSKIQSMILQAVPKNYTRTLAAGPTGYANVQPRAIMDHLLTRYGTITNSDLAANTKQLSSPSNDIEEVFTNCDECRAFADEAENPISDRDAIIALLAVFKTAGVLEKAVSTWKTKTLAQQTLEAFTTHFMEADRIRREELSEATPAALDANAAVGGPAKDATTETKPDTTNPGKGKPKGQFGNWSYCWTHGICTHTGHSCKFPGEGHQKEAVITNMMNGSSAINVRPNNNRNNGNWRDRRNRRNGNQENTPPPTN